MRDHIRDTLLAFFENQQMMETADYLGRGRGLERLSTDQLLGRWVEAFRAAFAVGGDPLDRAFSDLCAEVRLRGLGEPLELVQAEFAAAAERVATQRAILKAEGRKPKFRDDDPLMVFLREMDERRDEMN